MKNSIPSIKVTRASDEKLLFEIKPYIWVPLMTIYNYMALTGIETIVKKVKK